MQSSQGATEGKQLAHAANQRGGAVKLNIQSTQCEGDDSLKLTAQGETRNNPTGCHLFAHLKFLHSTGLPHFLAMIGAWAGVAGQARPGRGTGCHEDARRLPMSSSCFHHAMETPLYEPHCGWSGLISFQQQCSTVPEDLKIILSFMQAHELDRTMHKNPRAARTTWKKNDSLLLRVASVSVLVLLYS